MWDLIHNLIDFAKNNQMFAGLAAAGSFASIIYWAQSLPKKIWRLAIWSVSVEIEISNDSEAFQPFLRWLEDNAKAWHTRNFKLSTERSPIDDYSNDDDAEIDKTKNWIVAPGTGNHLIWYNKWPYRATRDIGDNNPGSGKEQNWFRVREVIRIRTPGFQKYRLEQLIESIKKSLIDENQLPILVWQWGSWCLVRNVAPRLLDTIILTDNTKEELINDLEHFRTAYKWYTTRGVPWRRGYLFTGPPGTGKSSLAIAIAGKFRMPIHVLNLGSIKEDNDLFQAMSRVPTGSLTLIEDVDTVSVTMTRTDHDDDKPSNGITLGALLNVLDGAIAEEGRVLIMTTNHPDKIDPALLRAGRVDRRFDFTYAGPTEIAAIYRLFFEMDIEVVAGTEMSPAAVQEICLKYANDPDAAAQLLCGNFNNVVTIDAKHISHVADRKL